jgi:methylenetetrahydrofolate reductase (NADPH)
MAHGAVNPALRRLPVGRMKGQFMAANLRDGRVCPEPSLAPLFADFSIEMTAKDVEQLDETATLLPANSMMSITFLPGESLASRVDAAAKVHALGLRPVPHISARRLTSAGELEGFLDALAGRINLNHVFIVAGDLAEPAGPYEDALAVIKSDLFQRYGVQHVGVAGYPEGHPQIDDARLWQALRDKSAVFADHGLAWSIMTQFGFDADPVLAWLERLRGEGILAPVRIGIAGPASVKALMRFALRCGVGTSAKVMKKYGLSITKLLGTAGPEPLLKDLATGMQAKHYGEAMLHLYPFGGLTRTAAWARDTIG